MIEKYNKLVEKYNELAKSCGEDDLLELKMCQCGSVPMVMKRAIDDSFFVECQTCKKSTIRVFNEMDSGAKEIVIEYWNDGKIYNKKDSDD